MAARMPDAPLKAQVRAQLRKIFSDDTLDKIGFYGLAELVAQELYSPRIIVRREQQRRIRGDAHDAAVQLGRRGGKARAKVLSAEKRREISKKGADARTRNYQQRREIPTAKLTSP
jgi:hypothetical protein